MNDLWEENCPKPTIDRRVHRIKYRKAAIFFAPALLEISGKPLDKKDKIINKEQNFTKLEKKHKTSPETCSKLG